MSNELPEVTTNNIPGDASPSRAEAQVEGIKTELERRADVLSTAQEEADRELAEAEEDLQAIDEELQRRIEELQAERDEKADIIEDRRRRAENAREEAQRMNALLSFAKGEIGLFGLFKELVF